MKKLLSIALVFIIMFALFSPPVSASPEVQHTAPKVPSGFNKTAKIKPWTYLVYLAADNNLDTWGDYSVNLMKTGLLNDRNVNVAVLYDHYGADAELLEVRSTGINRIGNPGEPDMANPATLQDFLSWGISTYPADRYVVSISSHGGGWKFVVQDAASHTRMSIADLSGTLDNISDELNRKIDVVVFDACIMSLIEVADQLKSSTDFMVASEQSVPATGFPYDAMLGHLAADPLISTEVYARSIADDFYNMYKTTEKAGLSISAIDESKLTPLVSSIDDLSLTLTNNMDGLYSEISGARGAAQHVVYGTFGIFWYIDIQRFTEELALKTNNSTIDSQAAAVVTALENAVYERHSKNLDGISHGLGVNFPPNRSRYEDKNYLAQNYQGVDLVFTAETHWDDMLLEYYRYQNSTVP